MLHSTFHSIHLHLTYNNPSYLVLCTMTALSIKLVCVGSLSYLHTVYNCKCTKQLFKHQSLAIHIQFHMHDTYTNHSFSSILPYSYTKKSCCYLCYFHPTKYHYHYFVLALSWTTRCRTNSTVITHNYQFTIIVIILTVVLY